MFARLQDTVYLRQIYLFVGPRQEFVAHLTATWGKQAAKGVPKDAIGLSHNFYAPSERVPGMQSRVFYLWVWQFKGTPHDIGTIAHECFHIAVTILEDLGVDTSDREGSESIAYYLDSLVRQCLEQLKGG